MAGGGHIIIRNALRTAANTDTVKDNIPAEKLARLNDIFAKSDGDWSDDETHFVRRCIGIAYDALT